jgi:putative ubiquitin-RnfH superfamily antitoxin RatB of RatAB toxin-antitoxin module
MADSIRVSVIYADPNCQIELSVDIDPFATVDDAIRASGITAKLPSGFKPVAIGIFGRTVSANDKLRAGDRIELYRPLKIDPKEARRRRAQL